jgi:hypothetical protein
MCRIGVFGSGRSEYQKMGVYFPLGDQMNMAERVAATREPPAPQPVCLDDVASIARQTAADFVGSHSEQAPLVDAALRAFLAAIFTRPEPQAVAFVDRRGSSTPPIFEIFLLWKKPINLAADGAVLRQFSAEHGKLAMRLIPTFNSFFHVVDPRQYPSVQQLETYLNAVGATGAAFKVLRCVSFKQ